MTARSIKSDMPQFMVGTCMGMCPNAEVRLRQKEELIHPLEMAVGPNGEKLKYSNPRLLVKEFSRSAAGQEILPANIRPLLVLEKTVKFLINNTCCRTDVPWALIYQFVNDRLRAVRQDLCVQGLKNLGCIKIHLASIRFYVYSHYKTYEHDLADFDPYLNKKTLMETLTIVLSHYRDLDKEEPPEEQSYNYVLSESDIEETWPGEEATDIEDESRAMEEDSDEKKITKDTQTNEKDFNREKTDVCSRLQDLHLQENTDESGPNLSEQSACRSGVTSSVYSVTGDHSRDEVVKVFSDREEAEALYILVNFGSEEAINYTLELPKHIRNSSLVSLALSMNFSWLTHNYHNVLRLSSRLPLLCLLAFHPHLSIVQRRAIAVLSRSHSCKGQVYNKEELAKTLFFSDVHTLTEACTHYGITVTDAGINFNKAAFKTDVPVVKNARLSWIEEKLKKVPLTDLLLPQEVKEQETPALFNILNSVRLLSSCAPISATPRNNEEINRNTTIMQHGHTGDHVEHVDFDSEGATINDMFLASFIPSSVTPRNSDELEMIVATMQHSCTGNYMGHTDVASVGATTSGTGKRLDGFACVELSLQQNIVINHDEKIKDNDSDNDSGIDSASFLDLQMEDFLKEISDPEIVLPIDGKQYRDTSSMAHCDADDFSVPKISDLGDCYGSCSMRSLENEYPNGDYTKNMDIESPFNTCSSLDYLPVTLPLTREYDVTQSLQSDLSDRTEEESGGINSGFERSAEKATLRRRRKEEMAQKVKEMREKQRSSEKWLEKKRMICNATCLYVVLFFLCFGILALFYQYYYMK